MPNKRIHRAGMALGGAAALAVAGVFGQPVAAADVDPVIRAAVDNEARRAEDRNDDEARKPGEVLTFFGIKPGHTVADLNAGGGYYTEILSYVVGDDGKVISHNDDLYAPFVGDQADARYEGRLANVTRIVGPLHRIDPALVRRILEEAGFEFVGESDVLRNPDDDLSLSPFDDSIRRKTDRFVFLFKKPLE